MHTHFAEEMGTSIVPGVSSNTNQTITFIESAACKALVTESYFEICKQVLDQRNSRNSLIQQALFMILPRLAALNKELFCQSRPG